MMEDYDGAHLLDADGNDLGTVERSYVDESGAVQFVSVKMGALFAKHRLVPVDQAQQTDQGLQVPYIKDVVEESPDVSSGDLLEGDALEQVRSYYAGDYGAAEGATGDREPDGDTAARPVGETDREATSRTLQPESDSTGEEPPAAAGEAGSGPPSTEVRDLGDVIEVPVVEEVMVKKPVVKEVLRVKKQDQVDRQTVSGEVRREQVEVASEGDVPGSTEVEDARS